MYRSFVFVSHASEDKSRLRPLLDALIEAGLKIWLDNPGHRSLGYTSREIEANFIDLIGGGRWAKQIDDALHQATCVLVCGSAIFAEKYADERRGKVLRDEVRGGQYGSRIVMCMLDMDHIGQLDEALKQEQIVDASNHDRVIRDIRLKMESQHKPDMKKPAARSPLGPYLIDRKRQETSVDRAIDTVANGGVQAIMIKAPRNECPDQFRQRLREVTSVKCLGSSWREAFVDWPIGATGDRFKEDYGRNLRHAYSVSGGAELQTKGAPLAPYSIVSLSEWASIGMDGVKAWLEFWHEYSERLVGLKAVPVLTVDLPDAKPGWKKFPKFREAGASTKAIWKTAEKLERLARKRDSGLAAFEKLDVLHPVTADDAAKWLSIIEPDAAAPRWRQLNDAIKQLFSGARRPVKEITMEEFATPIQSHFLNL